MYILWKGPDQAEREHAGTGKCCQPAGSQTGPDRNLPKAGVRASIVATSVQATRLSSKGYNIVTSLAPRSSYHATIREMPDDERPRERLEHYGPRSLKTEELLAIILRVGTVQENVLELSNRLLREFGGLGGLLSADFGDLCKIHGLGKAKAAQLQAALELGRRLSLLTPEKRAQISRPEDIANLVMLEMGYLAQEQLRVLCLDTKNYVIYQKIVYQGTVNSSAVRASEVFRSAIARNCPAIVVIHNHPSGDITPSPEDVRTTEQLRKAGELLDIELLDHVIVGQHSWISIRERRLGFNA